MEQEPDAEQESTAPVRHVTAVDDGGLTSSASLVADIRRADGTHAGYRIAKDDTTVSVDVDSSGTVSYAVHGAVPTRKDSEDAASRGLVDRLNRDGATWGQPVDPLDTQGAKEQGVDRECRSADGSERLQIQVTHAEQLIWPDLRRDQVAQMEGETLNEAVIRLRSAILGKQLLADRDIVLAVDATVSPWASLQSVVEEFRRREGEWVSALGFKAVWVVGPVIDRVYRLDGTSGT